MNITKAIIDKLASRRGARTAIVISFLNNMPDNKEKTIKKFDNMHQYNLSTMNAIRDGIRMRFDE